MHIVPIIRDYIELVNNFYYSVEVDKNSKEILTFTMSFIFENFKLLFYYLITLDWLRDISYLPTIIPKVTSSLVEEFPIVGYSFSFVFTFFEIPTYENNKFVVGFLNSFFLSLPLSSAHFITIRRFIIQGIPAGIASGLGLILGELLFIASVIFGFRSFLAPWVFFEPFSYIVGIVLVVIILYDMVHSRRYSLIKSWELQILQKFFFFNFFLAWTEQSCIFQYFGNITLSAHPTLLETFSPHSLQSKTNVSYDSVSFESFVLPHASYLLGLFVGSLVFTTIFGFLIVLIKNFWIKFSGTLPSQYLKNFNFSIIILTFGFTFASIPYYSLDYILTNPLGFFSQDKAFANTFLNPIGAFKDKRLSEKIIIPSYPPEGALFDRSQYIVPQEIIAAENQNTLLTESFEDLNYSGENIWKKAESRRYSRRKYKTREKAANFLSQFINLNKSSNKLSKFFTYDRLVSSESKPTLVGETEEKRKNLNFLETEISSNQTNGSTISSNTLQKEKNVAGEKPFLKEEDNLDDELELFDDQDADIKLNLQLKKIKRFCHKIVDSGLENSFTTPTAVDELFNLEKKLQNVDVQKQAKVEQKFKQNFYNNPVYKQLLKTDIDFFIARQPKFHYLTSVDEKTIFEKRLMLADYYESLFSSNKNWDWDSVFAIGTSPEIFSNKIYNQQFKGTRVILRRLFSLTLDEHENPEQKRILKFDQPLYEEFESKKNIFLHEELRSQKFGFLDAEAKTDQPPKVKPNDVFGEAKNLFSQYKYNSLPFYAGWDEELRKFAITSKISPRSQSAEEVTFFEKNKNAKRIQFTSWPIPDTILLNLKNNSTIPINILFDHLEIYDKEDLEKYNDNVKDFFDQFRPMEVTFPEEVDRINENLKVGTTIVPSNYNKLIKEFNIAKINKNFKKEIIFVKPKRGGFIWSGNKDLDSNIKEIVKKWFNFSLK